MAVGFLRGGFADGEARDAVLTILRRGPRPMPDLIQHVGEVLDRPGMRAGQLTPVVLRLSEKGFVKVTGRGQNKSCSLTLRGHEAARLLDDDLSEAGSPIAIETELANRDPDDSRRAAIEEFVRRTCADSGLTAAEGQ